MIMIYFEKMTKNSRRDEIINLGQIIINLYISRCYLNVLMPFINKQVSTTNKSQTLRPLQFAF